jgi:DivIVA domain-containing protein
MGTALIYLVVLIGVAAVFFLGATAVFGRGEELAPIPPTATPTWLPEPGQGVEGEDVRAVRFQQALRGYKMAEVDWVLERLAAELDRVQLELATVSGERDGLRGRLAELESAEQAQGGAT